MARAGSKNDVRLTGSDIHGQWVVIFMANADTDISDNNNITLNSKAPVKSAVNKTWESKHTISFRAAKSSVMIEEKFQPTTAINFKPPTQCSVAARVLLNGSQLRVIRHRSHSYPGNQGLGFDIIWNIDGDVEVQDDYSDKECRGYNGTLLDMVKRRPAMENTKAIMLRIRDFAKVKGLPDIQSILDIIGGVFMKSALNLSKEFFEKQNTAYESEYEGTLNRLEKLKRTGCTVKIAEPRQYPRFNDRVVLNISGPKSSDAWGMVVGQKVSIESNTHFVTKNATKDAEGCECWTAKVLEVGGNELLAVINNHMTHNQKERMYGHTVHGATIIAMSDDPLLDRLHLAIRNVRGAFQFELHGPDRDAAWDHDRWRLQVRCSPLFIDHPDSKLNSSHDMPFDLTDDNTSLEFKPEYRLLRTHKNVKLFRDSHCRHLMPALCCYHS